MNRKLRNEELDRLSVEGFLAAQKIPVHVVLDNVRSLVNIGTIFRTADAFLVKSILLCGITARPPHREIQKTALGATESVDWSYFPSTAEALDHLLQQNIHPIAVEQTEGSIPLQDFEPVPNQAYAFIFGHEVNGVEQAVVDRCVQSIEIPQFGTKHSLNVSISAGIVLWEAWRKIRKASL